MGESFRQSFSAFAESLSTRQEWDEERPLIEINDEPATIQDLLRVRTAESITLKNITANIRFCNGLKVDSLHFYSCSGNIVLGKNTSVRFMHAEDSSGLKELPENLTCETGIAIKHCAEFTKIGSGLVINRQGIDKGYSYFTTGLVIHDCPKFEMLEGAATINGRMVFREVPAFKGLRPDIRQDTDYGCMTDSHRYTGLPDQVIDDKARAELRALWETSRAVAIQPQPTAFG